MFVDDGSHLQAARKQRTGISSSLLLFFLSFTRKPTGRVFNEAANGRLEEKNSRLVSVFARSRAQQNIKSLRLRWRKFN